jgi:AbrB family looped-hinge helix DNA binding protein
MPPAIATVTSKGQITVPAQMRDRLRLRPGSKIVFEEQPNGDFLVRKKTGDIMDLKGFFPKPERTLSIEDIDDAIAREVMERDARSRQ